MGNDALRQVVGLDPVGHRQFLQARRQSPVAADHAVDQAVVAEMVEAAFLAVALPGRVDQGQAARAAEAVRVVLARFEEALFEGDGDVLGKADADETAGGDGVAVADAGHRITRRDDLARRIAGNTTRHRFLRPQKTLMLGQSVAPRHARLP
ncbi:hypothetical protein SDC9_178765 [bioreactor metagenome]|uniref:Uncharacterized protein n=1 Tax=bioreactor metagenome TaxID=1076179 RepID=A0A645GWM3_9ZZZZ